MDCSTPGCPVHYQLPEVVQTHVHRVSDTIQPSHPLSSPSPPALNLSQHQGFSSESVFRIRWPKCWSFSFSISSSNEYSGLISFNECSYSTSQFLLPVLAEALPEQIFVYFQPLWSQRSFSLDST